MNPASALVTASTQLLEDLAGGRRPLSSVSGSLADLAAQLGVQQVMVAIDDTAHGRQVFSSGRTLLGDHGELLVGPPRAVTDPPSRLDDALARLIVASVAAAFERARSAAPSDGGTAALVVQPATANDLLTRLRAATDRSTRYGWGFTLVVLLLDRADDHSTRQIEAHLRASDTLVEIGPRQYGILLPAAGGDEVPRLLARVGRDGAVSTFCYGLAACPGDGSEPGALLALATARLPATGLGRRRRCGSRRPARADPAQVHALEDPWFRVDRGVQRADAPPLRTGPTRGHAGAPQGARRCSPRTARPPTAGRDRVLRALRHG